MTDKNTSSNNPIGVVKRLRDATDRSLSEEFETRSPDTQQHIKDVTGGVTPTSGGIRRMTTLRHLDGSRTEVETEAETSEDRFNIASEYEKEMMVQHGLIPTSCIAYREYMKNLGKKTT